ncbi:MAG: hypothetical protein PHU06_05985 [Gallionella sp.]|nr:hypothetical protein [Gallionella sp.]MDD4958411.1 hypothetical protein [Gallionella sp.]
MTTIFEPGKTYKTRDGRNALIYCVDAPGDFPVHGRTDDGYVKSWTLEGDCMTFSTNGSADLMPPEPERIDQVVWVNVYDSIYIINHAIHLDEASASRMADPQVKRLAVPCRLVEIDKPIDGERHRV